MRIPLTSVDGSVKRLGTAEELLTAEEFERWQLEGRQVACRRCGLMRGEAVPMDVIGTRFLIFCGRFFVYRCPECGHHALSEVS